MVNRTEDAVGQQTVLTKKHDILYSKARHVLNQRNIKRPWFDLNPFLEKTDETIDLENYLPEESKYIQPLESLVLSEKYSCELPLDTRELGIDSFFDYVYSDEWKDACSIRVMEGQLLSELLVGLYRLEKDKHAVRHTTYAFARNTRPRKSCYKHADKQSYGHIDETLLLEFAYFGCLTKKEPNPVTLKPLEFLRQGLSDLPVPELNVPLPDIGTIPPIQEAPPKRIRATSLCVDNNAPRSLNLSLPQDVCEEVKSTVHCARRKSLMAKPLNAIRFINAAVPKSRRQSLAGPTSGLPLFAFKPIPERRRESVLESVKPQKRRASEFKYSKHDKIILQDNYTPDFDEYSPLPESDNEDAGNATATEVESDVFMGEEFYLTDGKLINASDPESTTLKLQRKKLELQERRAASKREKEDKKRMKGKGGIPPFPPTDVTMHSDDIKYCIVNMPDEVPTFEEFSKLLKEDEYYDPRYSNTVRLKTRKIAQRYYIAKGTRKSSTLFSDDSVPLNILRQMRLQQSSHKFRKSSLDPGSKTTIKLPTLQEGWNKYQKVPRKTVSKINNRDKWKFSEEVLGVTDSEPCKTHCLLNKSSFHKHRDDKLEHSLHMCKSPISPVFTKTTLCDEDSESSDTCSEDEFESDKDAKDDFDTKKLNYKYSIERLRKKRRNQQKKKKPVFYDILSKYYKMQEALTAFSKGNAGREVKNTHRRAKRMSIGKFLKGKALEIREMEKMVIGKLKKFNFNDTDFRKKKLHLNLSQADFSSPCLETFHKRLMECLNDFVVRREIVVTDLQMYKSVTSVTVTRKTCFKNKHTEC